MGCGASTAPPDGDMDGKMLPVAEGTQQQPARRPAQPPARAVAEAKGADPAGGNGSSGGGAGGVAVATGDSAAAASAAAASSAPLPPPATHERAGELFEAISSGDVDGVQALLNEGVPVDIVDEDGNTPLHKAAEGETDCVRVLLSTECGNTLRRKNGDGQTCLMAAIAYEDVMIVQMFLREGATVTKEAIDLARELDVPEILRIITQEDIPDRIVNARRGSEDYRRVSVSGDDVQEFTNMFKTEKETRRVSVSGAEAGGEAAAAADLVPERPDDDD